MRLADLTVRELRLALGQLLAAIVFFCISLGNPRTFSARHCLGRYSGLRNLAFGKAHAPSLATSAGRLRGDIHAGADFHCPCSVS